MPFNTVGVSKMSIYSYLHVRIKYCL